MIMVIDRLGRSDRQYPYVEIMESCRRLTALRCDSGSRRPACYYIDYQKSLITVIAPGSTIIACSVVQEAYSEPERWSNLMPLIRVHSVHHGRLAECTACYNRPIYEAILPFVGQWLDDAAKR